MERRTQYYIIFLFSQACGIISVILLLTYLLDVGSLSWKNENKFFIHAFVMFAGLVYLQGTSISAFRALNSIDKLYVKIVHKAIHGIVFIMNVIGLVAIFSIKQQHLLTFHGWLGLITVILFSAQGVYGFLGYFYPKAPEDVRRITMPYHRVIGLVIFVMALVNALIGLNMLSDKQPKIVMSAVLGLVFGIVVVISVRASRYRRDNIYD